MAVVELLCRMKAMGALGPKQRHAKGVIMDPK